MDFSASIAGRITFLTFSKAFNALIGVALLPFLARSLAIDEYGSYGQIILIIAIAKIIFSFGMGKLVYTRLSGSSGILLDKKSISQLVFSVLMTSSIGCFVIFFASEPIAKLFKNDDLFNGLKIYSLSIIFSAVSEVFFGIYIIYRKEKRLALIEILSNGIRMFSLFITIYFFFNLENIFFSLLIGEIIVFLINFYYLPINLSVSNVKLRLIFKDLSEGMPLLLSGIIAVFLVQTDGLMISIFLNEEKFAVYKMGAIPIPFLMLIFSSVISVTMGEVSKLFKLNSKIDIIKLKRKASSLIALASYPALIFILFFSDKFISFYLGDAYAPSAEIFFIYNFILFIRINDNRDLLIVSKQTKLIFFLDLAAFCVNLFCNYFLIILFGIKGAAISSILSFYLLSFSLNYFATKTMKTPLLSFFDVKKIGAVTLISVFLSLLFFLIESLLNVGDLYIFSIFIYIPIVYGVIFYLKILDISFLFNYANSFRNK